MKTRSLTSRLSLLFALGMAGVLFGLGWTLDHAVALHFRELDHQDIKGKLALVANLLAKADTPAALSALPRHLDEALVGHPGLAMRVQTGDGSLRFKSGTGQVPADPFGSTAATTPVDAAPPPRRWVQWQDGERSFRGLIAWVPTGVPTSGPAIVAIGLESHHQRFMAEFRYILALSIVLAAAAAAVLGWAGIRTGLQPLRRVTTLAAGLDANRLGARLPEAGVPAEIKALVDSFNAMLARLEDSFRRLSDFSADVAHELRTPISNLTVQTQVALGAARDGEQYREVLYSSLEEYERLARTISDMLFLAQADNGLLRPAAETVDLAAEVRELFDYFDAWAEERGVSLALEGSANACGDPLMLRRALSNLLSNAIRYTDAGHEVRVRLAAEGAGVRISIENPGPEIPPEQLSRLFDRFYRADPARGRQRDGAGLGLAIVKSVVAAHGGEVNVTSRAGRTGFTVTLPEARGVRAEAPAVRFPRGRSHR